MEDGCLNMDDLPDEVQTTFCRATKKCLEPLPLPYLELSFMIESDTATE